MHRTPPHIHEMYGNFVCLLKWKTISSQFGLNSSLRNCHIIDRIVSTKKYRCHLSPLPRFLKSIVFDRLNENVRLALASSFANSIIFTWNESPLIYWKMKLVYDAMNFYRCQTLAKITSKIEFWRTKTLATQALLQGPSMVTVSVYWIYATKSHWFHWKQQQTGTKISAI